MSFLKAWRTPFEAEEFPSVWVTCDGLLSNTAVFVGLPAKWRIDFEHIVGLKVSDETYDYNRRFHIEREDDSLCSYIWENSPWLANCDAEYVEVLGGSKVDHYVLLGGDYNVEILAYGKLQITAVKSS
jgi:hypothetical protein